MFQKCGGPDGRARTGRLAVSVAFLAITAARGAIATPAAQPRLVWMQQSSGPAFLFALKMDTGGREVPAVLPTGRVMGAATSRDGHWLVVQRRSGSKISLFRYSADRIDGAGELLGAVPRGAAKIWAVSQDGRVALVEAVEVEESFKADEPPGLGKFYVVRAGVPPEELMTMRYTYHCALADDGKRALVSGYSRSCVGSLRACPVELWILDWSSGPLTSRRLGEEAQASYFPVFVPGSSEVVFQRTFDDQTETCLLDLNRCPHELVRVTPEDPASERVLARRAIAPALSADGKSLAYLKFPETCGKLPCPSFEVMILRDGGNATLAGRGEGIQGTAWSPDAEWLVYSHRLEDTDGVRMCVLQTAQAAERDLGEGKFIGWLR
jgi:hypothetical protein